MARIKSYTKTISSPAGRQVPPSYPLLWSCSGRMPASSPCVPTARPTSAGFFTGGRDSRRMCTAQGAMRQSRPSGGHSQGVIQHPHRKPRQGPCLEGNRAGRHRIRPLSHPHPLPRPEEDPLRQEEAQLHADIQQICIRLPEVGHLEDAHGGTPQADDPHH